MDIDQPVKVWQSIRKHPLRTALSVLFILVVVAFSMWATGYFGEKGRQAASPRLKAPILKVDPATQEKEITSIEFENVRPFVDQAVFGDDRARKYWQVYYFKVQIHNKSYESTIRVKHLKLTDLRQLEGGVFKPWGNAEPVFLEWDVAKEIPPQDKVLVPFARIFPPELQRKTDGLLSGGVDTPQFRFTVLPGGWPRRMTSHVPPGTHRFRLTVFFENVPPVEAELELEWSGKQRESVESMAQEIKIRKL
jgi:hypothetical protein